MDGRENPKERKHRKPDELSELKSVVILEAAEKSQ